jgi:hypothetical protein
MKTRGISSPIATKNFVKRFRRTAGTAVIDAPRSSARQVEDKSLIRSSYRRVLSSQLTISATIVGEYRFGSQSPQFISARCGTEEAHDERDKLRSGIRAG